MSIVKRIKAWPIDQWIYTSQLSRILPIAMPSHKKTRSTGISSSDNRPSNDKYDELHKRIKQKDSEVTSLMVGLNELIRHLEAELQKYRDLKEKCEGVKSLAQFTGASTDLNESTTAEYEKHASLVLGHKADVDGLLRDLTAS